MPNRKHEVNSELLVLRFDKTSHFLLACSTRGLGKALAREFLIAGDRVVIASRRYGCSFNLVEDCFCI